MWLSIPTGIGIFLVYQLYDASQLHIRSYTDTFRLNILEIQSQPNVLQERIRVQCSRDMEIGLWVYDFEENSLSQTRAPNGEIIFREGHPHKLGGSMPVRADGEYSTGEVFFRVTTSSTNVSWHDEFHGKSDTSTADTTLPEPLTITAVETNWPDAYQRGTALPLASLGRYKILLLVK